MSRRAGVAAVAVILVFLIAGPTRRQEVSGLAAPAAVDHALAAGLCVTETDRARPVQCTDPHTAQIIRTWNIGGEPFAPSLLGDLKRGCWQRGRTVLQPLGLDRPDPFSAPVPGAAWAAPPVVFDTDIVAIGAEAGPDMSACVITPRSAVTPDVSGPLTRVGTFAGTLGDLIPMASRPLNLRACYAVADRLPDTVSCRSWHRGEVLAIRSADDGTPTQDDATVCRSTAAELMGTQDPSRGGRLTVRVVARPAAGQITALAEGQEDLFLFRCVVETSDDRFLTDSIVGLGDNAPPLN